MALAGCSDYFEIEYDEIVGQVLSIYNTQDEKFGSCTGYIRSSQTVRFKEITLDSAKGHKLFRIGKDKFIKQWLKPMNKWVESI